MDRYFYICVGCGGTFACSRAEADAARRAARGMGPDARAAAASTACAPCRARLKGRLPACGTFVRRRVPDGDGDGGPIR